MGEGKNRDLGITRVWMLENGVQSPLCEGSVLLREYGVTVWQM